MKKMLFVLLSSIMLVNLAGCSSEKQDSSTTAKSSTTEISSTETNTSKNYSFYKDAKTNSRIYYKLNLDGKSFGKETIIDSIIYINKGNYTYYEVSNNETSDYRIEHTLTDLKDLSDKQILDKAIEWNKEVAEKYVVKGKEEANKRLESAKNENLGYDGSATVDRETKNIELLNEYKYEEPEALSLEIKAETDASGNNLEMEYIILPDHNFKIKSYVANGWDQSDTSQPDLQLYYPNGGVESYSIYPTQQTSEVYEKTYAYGPLGDKFVLATKGNQIMELDSINEKGLLDSEAISKHYNTTKDLQGISNITWK